MGLRPVPPATRKAQKRVKYPPTTPRLLKTAPNMVTLTQGGLQDGPRRSKLPPSSPKKQPRRPNMPPRCLRVRPRSLKDGPRRPERTPRRSQGVLQEGAKRPNSLMSLRFLTEFGMCFFFGLRTALDGLRGSKDRIQMAIAASKMAP
eukprot:3084154-Pyramimonas_sp.AAC.1